MPLFEYVCAGCGHAFEALVYGSEQPECPDCGGRRLEKQLSAFAAPSGEASGESPSPGSCGSCGDPRGPGACSLN